MTLSSPQPIQSKSAMLSPSWRYVVNVTELEFAVPRPINCEDSAMSGNSGLSWGDWSESTTIIELFTSPSSLTNRAASPAFPLTFFQFDAGNLIFPAYLETLTISSSSKYRGSSSYRSSQSYPYKISAGVALQFFSSPSSQIKWWARWLVRPV